MLPVAALLVTGCGGGGGGDESTESTTAPTATTTALTKAELIEQGDAICAEVNAAVGTVGASSAETGSPAGQAADLYSGMIASLKNLGTPQETDGFAEFSTAADELATAEDEVKLASERGDTAGVEAAESSASSSLASFQNAASEYGFKNCSEGPSAPVTTAPSGESGEAEAGEETGAVESEAVEPEVQAESAPEVAPETGGAGGAPEGGGTGGGTEGGGGGTTGGGSGGIGPG
ncbi:MAG: hypothetical protein QOF85_864 [Solirubrobacterales bacterium]|nr:hypothetical protein [Solirubrobacterales bacterium]